MLDHPVLHPEQFMLRLCLIASDCVHVFLG